MFCYDWTMDWLFIWKSILVWQECSEILYYGMTLCVLSLEKFGQNALYQIVHLTMMWYWTWASIKLFIPIIHQIVILINSYSCRSIQRLWLKYITLLHMKDIILHLLPLLPPQRSLCNYFWPAHIRINNYTHNKRVVLFARIYI